jgi:hypothetical protein
MKRYSDVQRKATSFLGIQDGESSLFVPIKLQLAIWKIMYPNLTEAAVLLHNISKTVSSLSFKTINIDESSPKQPVRDRSGIVSGSFDKKFGVR